MSKREQIEALQGKVAALEARLAEVEAVTCAAVAMVAAQLSVLKARKVFCDLDAQVVFAAGSEVHKVPKRPTEVLAWARTTTAKR